MKRTIPEVVSEHERLGDCAQAWYAIRDHDARREYDVEYEVGGEWRRAEWPNCVRSYESSIGNRL